MLNRDRLASSGVSIDGPWVSFLAGADRLELMTVITGLVATLLVFLAGPYRTMQVKWPETWGRRINVRAHGNVSLAATVAVMIHIGPELGMSLTWVGTWLFFVSLISGFYGIYVARTPERRRAWMRRHRILTFVFYTTILPHIVGQLLGWALIGGAALAWVSWRWRHQMRANLVTWRWPIGKPKTKVRPAD